MFGLFKSRTQSSKADEVAYKPYSTKFDLEIPADQIDEIVGTGDLKSWGAYADEYDNAAAEICGKATLAANREVSRIKTCMSEKALSNTVACLLIDHSGSLRGQRAVMACAISEVVADFWSSLGIAYEILGFTTQSWHGGRSRKLWKRRLRPRNPGRLCDLLHIVYRSADDTKPGVPWSIRNVLRPALLKENVDGEAVLWAAERLRRRAEPRKIIIVLSDGAPVDDSTLMHNHPDILTDHLKAVISQTSNETGFSIAAISLDDDYFGLYSNSIKIAPAGMLTGDLPEFVANLMIDES
ncbi:cobaltochelatase CobT-related protein [Anderseniella sp. Alg231-50]|uniref:cobaltochelatase CobT-related protein n=1 Tax=Anderseniella sp. Alg231-50 TaxID=1922226 RepID=UPI000D54CFCD